MTRTTLSCILTAILAAPALNVRLLVISVLAVSVLLASCSNTASNSPMNETADANGDVPGGACTYQFIYDYNIALRNADMKSTDSLKNVEASCKNFREHHANGLTCIASNQETKENMNAESAKVYKACAYADQVLGPSTGSTPALSDKDSPKTIANCSEPYMALVKKVMTNAQTALGSLDDQSIKKARATCNFFQKSYDKNYSCKATIETTDSPTQVDSFRVYNVCDQLNQIAR